MPTIPIKQQSPYPGGQRAAAAKPAVPDNPRLWDRETTCAFFGGIDVSTLYRGMYAGRYPRPVMVSANVARWLADECEEALQRLIAARDEPRKRPERRGRKDRQIAHDSSGNEPVRPASAARRGSSKTVVDQNEAT